MNRRLGVLPESRVLDEGIQVFQSRRVFEPEGILFNEMADLMAKTASMALGWARHWDGGLC